MANPDVRVDLLMDLYLSPQSYDPGSPSRVEGTRHPPEEGEEKTVGGVTLHSSAASSWTARRLNANPPRVDDEREVPRDASGGKPPETTAEARHTHAAAGRPGGCSRPRTSPIPGTPNGRFRIPRVRRNDGSVEIEVLGLNPAGDVKPPTHRELLGRRHDEAAHLPRLGRLLRDDGGGPRRPPPPRPRRARGVDGLARLRLAAGREVSASGPRRAPGRGSLRSLRPGSGRGTGGPPGRPASGGASTRA